MSFLNSKDNAADSSGLTGKVMSSLGPVMAEHWPKIAPYADQALAAAQDDTTFETLARKIYPWLPAVARFALKEDRFVAFSLEHKEPLLAKLEEVKNRQGT